LLKTLYADLPLRQGDISVAGVSIRGIKNHEVPLLRRKIGIIFQDFQLLSDRSALENLLFVLKATGWKKKQDMLDRANEVLKKVGLENKGYKWPSELSGGEQQRLVIARALLNNPKVVLADEPTGSLDPEISDEVMSLLQQICSEGTSVVMATHDYRLIQKFGGHIYEVKNQQIQRIPDISHLNW
jgi:cell division transport system ATP-binding protein